MPLETFDLIHDAVLWPVSGTPDSYGNVKLSSKVGIKSRWRSNKSENAGPTSNTIQQSFTIIVDREVPVGSLLWKGKLTDYTANPTGIVEVTDYREVTDIKGIETRRTVTAVAYNKTIPTQI